MSDTVAPPSSAATPAMQRLLDEALTFMHSGRVPDESAYCAVDDCFRCIVQAAVDESARQATPERSEATK